VLTNTVDSLVFVLTLAPKPATLMLKAVPDLVFQGTFLQLTCTATFPQTTNVNLTVTMEFDGPSTSARRKAVVSSTSSYIATFYIPRVSGAHSGNYSCAASTSGSYLIQSILVWSNLLNIIASKF